jgi:hypothetical protein
MRPIQIFQNQREVTSQAGSLLAWIAARILGLASRLRTAYMRDSIAASTRSVFAPWPMA